MAEPILVVDDEEKIRGTLRGVLADEGYEVLEASDGRRALELLEAAAPRLAIVDVWMPDMDGIELVQRMRALAPGMPIIVISGHGTIETAVRVIRLGAFDFLEKPIALQKLLTTVQRALKYGGRIAVWNDMPEGLHTREKFIVGERGWCRIEDRRHSLLYHRVFQRTMVRLET